VANGILLKSQHPKVYQHRRKAPRSQSETAESWFMLLFCGCAIAASGMNAGVSRSAVEHAQNLAIFRTGCVFLILDAICQVFVSFMFLPNTCLNSTSFNSNLCKQIWHTLKALLLTINLVWNIALVWLHLMLPTELGFSPSGQTFLQAGSLALRLYLTINTARKLHKLYVLPSI